MPRLRGIVSRHGRLTCWGKLMLEEKLKEAIIDELKYQASVDPKGLQIRVSEKLIVNGNIDLDELVMVIAGSVAGGP